MHSLDDLTSGQLKGQKSIKLSCNLREIPEAIFEISDTLEILDLSGNQISLLPQHFKMLKKLRILFLSDNIFSEFPSILYHCPSLEMIGFKSNMISTIPEDSIPENTRWLILTNNKIPAIPKSIGKCHRLQKCMLAGNLLTSLPQEMANCRNIELLRISANQFTHIPEWVYELPKLAWLALAGNPAFNSPAVQPNIETTHWDDLQTDQKLGEGASGIIYKAYHKTRNEFVALKIYKGGITSDGYAEDELKACLLAGEHPNLVKVLSLLEQHPEGKLGLILELLPSNYKNLGGPPSFETCTRDVFDKNIKLDIEALTKIVKSVASAMAQLHERGIMHGDLYAHNTLIDEEYHTMFGDFGAATIYDKSNKSLADKLEKLDIRAFGFLLDDLLALLPKTDKTEPKTIHLEKLRDRCLNTQNMIPNFISIFNNDGGI